MALLAPRPSIIYPISKIPPMPPGLPDRPPVGSSNAWFSGPSSSSSSRSERTNSQLTSPKRPRLSTPSGRRNLLSEDDGQAMRGRANLGPHDHFDSLRSAPIVLPSVSILLGRDDTHTNRPGFEQSEDHTREKLRRLSIGPFGDPQQPIAGPSRPYSPRAGFRAAIASHRAQDFRTGSRNYDQDMDRSRQRYGLDQSPRSAILYDGRPSPPRSTAAEARERSSTLHSSARTSHSHSRSNSLVTPSDAWFSPAAPPSAWHRDRWRREEQTAYSLGFDDAMRSVERGVVGVMGRQYRNPVLVTRDIPPVVPGTSISDPASPSRPPGPPSPRRPHTTQSPTRVGHRPHTREGSALHEDLKPGPSSPNRTRTDPYPRRQSLTSGHSLPPLTALDSFTFSSQSTSPRSHTSVYSSPSGESIPTRGPGRGPRQLISCFPCRAKKLKCDGVKPCSQCIRRKEVESCAFAEFVKRRGMAKRNDDKESGSRSGSSPGTGDRMQWDTVGKVERHERVSEVKREEVQEVDGESSSGVAGRERQ